MDKPGAGGDGGLSLGAKGDKLGPDSMGRRISLREVEDMDLVKVHLKQLRGTSNDS